MIVLRAWESGQRGRIGAAGAHARGTSRTVLGSDLPTLALAILVGNNGGDDDDALTISW
jgi:hypothetical protein